MNKQIQKNILLKKAYLENARKILHQEFFGIDKIIDQIIDNVSGWYFLPELQEKPVVINLWGLTGVGKTSLVNRLIELLNFENAFYHLDLGVAHGNHSLYGQLDLITSNDDDKPIVFALDEFQFNRSINRQGEELSEVKSHEIWELIDTGKISFKFYDSPIQLYRLIKELTFLVNAGIQIKDGMVLNKKKLYHETLETRTKGEELLFVPEDCYSSIRYYVCQKYAISTNIELKNKLKTLTAEETITFLEEAYSMAKRQEVMHYKQALIFVLGNLDEVYTMSNNFSADLDADLFHDMSLKITIPKIKDALKKRFRNEQIARLGNTHIIYPSLSQDSYCRIIQRNILIYIQKLEEQFDFSITIDPSVFDLIYREGVYPTQGVRPVLTTINELFKSKVSFFIAEVFTHQLSIRELHFSVEKKFLVGEYIKNDEIIHTAQTKIKTFLGALRENTNDDKQIIIAVHESGHALLSILLLGRLPEVVQSVSSDSDNMGFTYIDYQEDMIAKKEIIPRTAVLLGGYMAEELIFGKENVTAGSSSDIQKATEFVTEMFKSCGMDDVLIKYRNSSFGNNMTYHKTDEIEEKIKNAILDASELARKMVKENEALLLKFSNYLTENSLLSKEKIVYLLKDFGYSFTKQNDEGFYRACLKEKSRMMFNKEMEKFLA